MPRDDPLQLAVDLDLFQGPFDLLLTLLLREEIELLELPLADLVEDALGERAVERWDLGTAGELILILAALAELKARQVLGEPGDEEPDPDAVGARERLVNRLVAYAPFQRAGEWLGGRDNADVGPRYRRIPLDAAVVPTRSSGAATALRDALTLLFVSPPEPSLSHLTSRDISLPVLLTRLRDALRAGRSVSFDEMVASSTPLQEAITLLAALELARRQEVTLDQAVPFGDITITGATPGGRT